MDDLNYSGNLRIKTLVSRRPEPTYCRQEPLCVVTDIPKRAVTTNIGSAAISTIVVAINKGDDQTALMRQLNCAFVVRKSNKNKKVGKDQESIQSSTTPDQEYDKGN